MGAIQDRLKSEDHMVYLQAVNELSDMPRAEVQKLLWGIAQSTTGRIQARMMNPLRKYDPELANKLALQILHIDSSDYHADALYSLWKTRSSCGIAKASQMLLSHPDSVVRLSCATYLGECGSVEQIPTLEQVLQDSGADEEGREVRSIAAAAIASILESNQRL